MTKHVKRGLKSETLSRSVIEEFLCFLDGLFGDAFEAHILWEELANQTIHILIGATFPRRIWVCKVYPRFTYQTLWTWRPYATEWP